MTHRSCPTIKLRFTIPAIAVLLLLAACDAGILTTSAQGASGGVGAGLSQYQK